MKCGTWIGRLLAGAALFGLAGAAPAQNVVKLGMVGEFSGPFAQYGQQMLGGMKAYMKQNGDTVAGKKIEIIQKDTTAGAGAVSGAAAAFKAPTVAQNLPQVFVIRP